MLSLIEMRHAPPERSAWEPYRRNPRCFCPWCENGGVNPEPGPATLGYEEPHVPV